MPLNLLIYLDYATIFIGPLVGAIILRDPFLIGFFALLTFLSWAFGRKEIKKKTIAYNFAEKIIESLKGKKSLSEIYNLQPEHKQIKKKVVAYLLFANILHQEDDKELYSLNQEAIIEKRNHIFMWTLGFTLFYAFVVLMLTVVYNDISLFLKPATGMIVTITLIKITYLSIVPIHLEFH